MLAASLRPVIVVKFHTIFILVFDIVLYVLQSFEIIKTKILKYQVLAVRTNQTS